MSTLRSLSTRDKFLIVLFCLAIFVSAFNRFKESDSFYHLKTGQLILETRSVPTLDVYSYTAEGAAWVPHEWLAQVLNFGIYDLVGFWGLIAFSALLATGTYLFLLLSAIRRGADPSLSAVIFLIFGYLTLELWIPRPQIFAFVLWALLLHFLEAYRHSGHSKYLIGTAFITLVWSNMHASVVLGLATILWYALSSALSGRLPGQFIGPDKPRASRPLWLAFLGSFALALINPSTYHILLYPIYIQTTSQALHVLEWKPILAFWGTRREIALFVYEMLAVGAFLVWWLGVRRMSRNLVLLALVLGISALPFLSIRHAGFWPLTVLLPLAVGLSDWSRNFLNRVSSAGERFGLAAIVCLTFFVVRGIALPAKYYNPRTVPVEAVDFMDQNNVQGPIFNLYNEGGYLIWRLWPREKVFIDGRSEVYGPEQVQDFLYLATGSSGWQELLNDKYKVNTVFLSQYPVPRLKESIRPLVESLVQSGWRLVYWDDAALIYLRPDGNNAAIAEKWQIRNVSPFREPESIPSEEVSAVRAELRLLLERFPDSEEVVEYARRFALGHPLR